MALSVGKIIQRALLLVTGSLFLGATAVYFIGSTNAAEPATGVAAAPAPDPAPEVVASVAALPEAEIAVDDLAEAEVQSEGGGWMAKVSGFFQSGEDDALEAELGEFEMTEFPPGEATAEDAGPRVVIRGGSQPAASGTCRMEGGVRRCTILAELPSEE
jgi:hypothetical protein